MMGDYLFVKGSKFKLYRTIENVATFVSVSQSLGFIAILEASLKESVATRS